MYTHIFYRMTDVLINKIEVTGLTLENNFKETSKYVSYRDIYRIYREYNYDSHLNFFAISLIALICKNYRNCPNVFYCKPSKYPPALLKHTFVIFVTSLGQQKNSLFWVVVGHLVYSYRHPLC